MGTSSLRRIPLSIDMGSTGEEWSQKEGFSGGKEQQRKEKTCVAICSSMKSLTSDSVAILVSIEFVLPIDSKKRE